jgi:hypothetical protein
MLRCIALRNVVSRPSRRRRNLGSGSKWISDNLIWSSRVGRTNVPWRGIHTHYHCMLFLFFFISGCIRHRVFSTQTGPVYAGVITVRFQHGHGRCCAALSRLCTGRRGSSSVSFRLSGAREGRGAIPRYLPVRHVTSFGHKLHTWACLSISTRTRATTRSRSQSPSTRRVESPRVRAQSLSRLAKYEALVGRPAQASRSVPPEHTHAPFAGVVAMTPRCPLTSGATSTSQSRGFGMAGQSLTGPVRRVGGRRQYPLPLPLPLPSRRVWWIHFSPL